MSDTAVLILAAGKGERMHSEHPKVLHPLGGQPLLSYSIQVAKSLKPKKLLVITGHKSDEVRKEFNGDSLKWVLQRQQLGTAHAVLCSLDSLKGFKGLLFILYGDVPLLKLETLEAMKSLFLAEQPSLVLLTTHMERPQGYGRVIRDERGEVQRVVEEKEAQGWEKEIKEVNTGIYLARFEDLVEPLQSVRKSVIKGEYYLTDLVLSLVKSGKRVMTVPVSDSSEVMGINSQVELARAEQSLQDRIRQKWMERGVTLLDPNSTRIGIEVEIAPDVILHPGVILSGITKIGRDTHILPYCVIDDTVIGEKARIGPFAHLRPGTVIGEGAHVGNFVELKKTQLDRGAKANHLSYLGDAEIGEGANIGAGTITCNYDGFEKHKTIIGEKAFI